MRGSNQMVKVLKMNIHPYLGVCQDELGVIEGRQMNFDDTDTSIYRSSVKIIDHPQFTYNVYPLFDDKSTDKFFSAREDEIVDGDIILNQYDDQFYRCIGITESLKYNRHTERLTLVPERKYEPIDPPTEQFPTLAVTNLKCGCSPLKYIVIDHNCFTI